MRTRLPWVLAAWILAAAPAFGQPAPPPSITGLPGPDAANPLTVAQVPPPPPTSEMPVIIGGPPAAPDCYRIWAHAEYLGYWVKNAPLPVSLVTGDPNNPTQELLNTPQSLGMFSGFRVGLGVWIDPYNNLGLETSAFSLQQRTRNFTAASDGNGNPTLAFPFTNQTPGAVGDTFMPITSPGLFAGSVLVSSSLQFWGLETNGVLVLVHQGGFELQGLVGFRYVDLQESLNISTLSADIMTTPNTVLFQNDSFNTRNQFYGAQIGTRVKWEGERFGLDLTGKLALGGTHQTVDIQGVSVQSGPGGVNGTFPGGFFTQPSNMGRTSATQFGVIPSVELKFYAKITPNLRAFVGYDFMYWNQVVRPGSQVDQNINLSQSAIYGSGTLSGPAYPNALFNRTDFWAQGINVGLELRF